MKRAKIFGWLPALLTMAAAWSPAADLPPLEIFRDPEVVKIFEAIPVQDSGRIKPLDKMAEVRLKSFRGRVTIWLTEDGEMDGKPLVDPATQRPVAKSNGKPMKLSAMEWMLVSWFRPDFAKTIPLFTVDNSSAIAELGLPTKAKRDQYSFQDILPARETLMEKMQSYRDIPESSRTPEQRMIVNLASSFLDDEMLVSHFEFARAPLGDKPEGLPAGVEQPVRLSKSLPALLAELKKGTPPMQIPWFQTLFRSVFGAIMSGNPERQLRIFPPADPSREVWDGPGNLMFDAIRGEAELTPDKLEWLASYEELWLSLPDPAKFKTAAANFLEKVRSAAAKRGEGKFIGLELHAIHMEYFFYAQWIFLVGLILVALTWVAPGSAFEWFAKLGAWLFLSAATALAVTGIVIRCIIMQRPPITTLYETILFIGAAAALFGLIMEGLSRRGLGLLVSAVMGTACMFLAGQFDASEASDSLQQLQAVLITNFWLSTHVPMINLGYAACMVAAVLSQFYFFYRMRFFGRRSDHIVEERRFLTKAAYGFVCAGLLLSLVGTVLGGIWANYSWGRFWGWDPKENGALMIVLMCLAILHARLGGYIREVGLHCCGLILGCIVVFSWFGVNQLGVGLHAYGFTEGTWPKIYAYWLSQLALLGFGIVVAMKDRRRAEPSAIPEAEAAVVSGEIDG